MKRRRLIAAISATALGGMALLLVLFVLFVTRTRFGQDRVRGIIASRIAPALKKGGSLYLGNVDLSSFLSRISIDSIEIKDETGEVFFVSGRISAGYDWRDLSAQRIALHNVLLEHPFLHLRQHNNDVWNFTEIFRSDNTNHGPPVPKTAPSWGDYVVLDSLHIQKGQLVLSLPWRADDTLHGAALDSTIARELRRTDHTIRRTSDGFERRYTWANATASLPYIRLADPDSDKKAGRVIRIDDMRVDEADPPFLFRRVHGVVQLLNDSLAAAFTHFELPGSAGSAIGGVKWGNDRPIRYAFSVHADSISLADVNWVYPTLPSAGGGRAHVTVSNVRNPRQVEFRLDSLDMHSTGSHLTGTMTFATGEPLLVIRDINVKADPLDFDFIHALAGKPMPIDWRGQLVGALKGPGGALNHFLVDDVHGEWHDSHVKDAVTTMSGSGELNVVDPGNAGFHAFKVNVGSLDLGSIEYLFPTFPKLGGTVAGSAVLDGTIANMHFSDGDFTHHDGPDEPSHFTGEGSIVTEPAGVLYDLTLMAQQLSFTMIARSYPSFPLRGMMGGPLRIGGGLSNLAVTTSLSGPAGSLSFDGRIDGDSVGGYGAHGQGAFADLDLRRLTGGKIASPLTGTGSYMVDVTGSTATDLDGKASLDLERAVVDSTRLTRAHAAVAFANGVARISDSIVAEGPAGRLFATGALGLPKGGNDSLRVRFITDSLSLWRPYVGVAAMDSILGHFDVLATVSGRMDAFAASGTDSITRITYGKVNAQTLAGAFSIADVLGTPRGTVDQTATGLHAAAYAFSTATFGLDIFAPTHIGFSLSAGEPESALSGRASGDWTESTESGASQSIRLDSATVYAQARAPWRLESPARIYIDSTQLRLDNPLSLIRTDGATFSVRGFVPDKGAVQLDIAGRGVPLRDAETIGQADTTMLGFADIIASVRGTRAKPEIATAGTIRDFRMHDVSLDSITAVGAYRNDRLDDTISIFDDSTVSSGPKASMSISVPLSLSLFDYKLLDDAPLTGRVQGGNIDLGLVQTVFKNTLKDVAGKVSTNELTLSGTVKKPRLMGAVSVNNAHMNIPALGSVMFSGVNSKIRFYDDEIAIDSLTAHSGAGKGDHLMSLKGVVKMRPDRVGIDQMLVPAAFDTLLLQARDFAIYNQYGVAQINITTEGRGIQLFGPVDSAKLTGQAMVSNSVLILPDVKSVTHDVVSAVDTSATRAAAPEPEWIRSLTRGLQLRETRVDLGDNVTLQSAPDDPADANIRLTGALTVLRSDTAYGLALQGTLTAGQGGRYTYAYTALQRQLSVQSSPSDPSTISFNGDASNIPTLDLKAAYISKQFGRQDVTILATLKGPLRPGPTLEFTSPDLGSGLSQSDYASYLLFGQPGGLGLADNANPLAVIGAVLGPSASNFLTSSLGSAASHFSFQGANVGNTNKSTTGQAVSNYFAGSRVQYEAPLPGNLFVSAGAGVVCAIQSANIANTFAQSLSATLEWRPFGSFTRVQASILPPASALYCSPSFSNLPGLAPTPQQFGLSFAGLIRW